MSGLARRLLSALGSVLLISVLVFLAIRLLPSDPARVILGPGAPEASLQVLREQLGLHLPLWQQYLHWLGAALGGDLGLSLDSQVAVTQLLGQRFANSLALLIPVALCNLLLAVGLGTLLALYRDRWIDRLTLPLLVMFKSLPGFVLAIGLIMLFATSLFTWLPAVSLLDPEHSAFTQGRYLVLPVAALVLASAPYLIRLVRGAMIEALHSDYLEAARLRGLQPWRLVLGHALPNAVLPLIQGLALTLSVFFSSTLLVEMAFTYPGVGSLLNDAIRLRDVPVIQGGVSAIAAFVVGVNLLADVLARLCVPKLRTQHI
ncbi:ABC transporter permease [Pseudomonas sp. FP453]|uniref:ABC transporter permease n=1 Tax=Pseudomonas sp. FP453 TaxID=2954094 RepID=UPI002733E4ED|nr:ABC transporter permease [Pseudomonas sp. FP453]WLH92864.1 ABC transporter permease [Pseudomonas sp. FP453]